MQKDLFTTRLLSLLAVQDGLVPASSIGLTIKHKRSSIKNQLRAESIAMPIKRRSRAKQK
jgi:hypothetical protein